MTITLLPPGESAHYDNSGIRKGILLARYAGTLKEWLGQTRNNSTAARAAESPLGTWERPSSPLQASSDYRIMFGQFAEHFKQEMDAIGDESLPQELDLLEALAR